jgi:hypothetical protein
MLKIETTIANVAAKPMIDGYQRLTYTIIFRRPVGVKQTFSGLSHDSECEKDSKYNPDRPSLAPTQTGPRIWHTRPSTRWKWNAER